MKISLIAAFALAAALLSGCGGDDPAKPERPSVPGTETDIPGEPETPAETGVKVASVADLKALGTLKPGAVVVWKNGTYKNVTLDLDCSGTASAPVVVKAETPGGVFFQGASSVTLRGSYTEVSGFIFESMDRTGGKDIIRFEKTSSFCKVSDCLLDGSSTAEDASATSKWVRMYGTDNEFSGCTLRDKKDLGVTLELFPEGKPLRHKVLRNVFYHPVGHFSSGYSGINGQEIIRVGTSQVSMQEAFCEVAGNVFLECVGENGEIVSNKSCRNSYTGNVFEYCWGALTLRHGNGCTVSGNYFRGGKSVYEGGVRVIGEDHVVSGNYFRDLSGSGARSALSIMQGVENPELHEYFQVKNLKVSDNSFLNCAYSIYINLAGGSGDRTTTLPATGVTFTGNTVSCSSSSAYTVYMLKPEAGGITWERNRFWGGRQYGTSLETLSAAPTMPVFDSRVNAIKAAAGVSWERENASEN